jgi:hypothetical protein
MAVASYSGLSGSCVSAIKRRYAGGWAGPRGVRQMHAGLKWQQEAPVGLRGLVAGHLPGSASRGSATRVAFLVTQLLTSSWAFLDFLTPGQLLATQLLLGVGKQANSLVGLRGQHEAPVSPCIWRTLRICCVLHSPWHFTHAATTCTLLLHAHCHHLQAR